MAAVATHLLRLPQGARSVIRHWEPLRRSAWVRSVSSSCADGGSACGTCPWTLGQEPMSGRWQCASSVCAVEWLTDEVAGRAPSPLPCSARPIHRGPRRLPVTRPFMPRRCFDDRAGRFVSLPSAVGKARTPRVTTISPRASADCQRTA
jgi:hypothetical protein